MRFGVSLPDPSGPDAQGRSPLGQVRDALQRAVDDGFSSAWISNIFGLDALTALAVAGFAASSASARVAEDRRRTEAMRFRRMG